MSHQERRSEGVTTSNCLHALKTATKSVVRASASYENGSTPAMQEVLEVGRGASACYKEFNKELSRCKAISFTSQGQTISGSVGAMSFPKVGKSIQCICNHAECAGSEPRSGLRDLRGWPVRRCYRV